MTVYAWDIAKNEWLMRERRISFERIVFQIEQGGLLDIMRHPDTERFPHQQIYIVEVDDYAWIVPFVETDAHIFLKTVIPSRKATRNYLTNKRGKSQ